MNSFACFGSSLVKGTIDPNSILSVNRSATAITLASNGVTGNNLTAITGYSTTAWGINPTNGNTTFLSLKQGANNLTTPTSNFTFYIKHAERFYTDSIFGHGYTITSSASSVTAGNSFIVSFYSLYPTISLPYTITGVTSSDLSGASLTGNWTSNYQAITYIVSTTIGSSLNFSMMTGTKTLPVSLNIDPVLFFSFNNTTENTGIISGTSTFIQTGGNSVLSSQAQYSTKGGFNCLSPRCSFYYNFDYINTNGYTIGCHIFLDGTSFADYISNNATGNGGDTMAFDLHDNSDNTTYNRMCLYIYAGGVLPFLSSNTGSQFGSQISITANTWHYYVFTQSTGNTGTVYMDISSTPIIGPSTTSSVYKPSVYTRMGFFNPFASTNKGSANKKVYLRNFIYYDRVLTPTQIGTLMTNNGQPI